MMYLSRQVSMIAALWLTVSISTAQVFINNLQVEGDFEFENYEEGDQKAGASGLTPPVADGRYGPLEEELERYLRHKKWPEAFAILQAMDNLPAGGFGLWRGTHRPVSDILLMRLLELSPEGRQAYQLFNNANAEAVVKSLPPTISTTELDRLAIRWFLTESGASLADRAAIACFRDGQYQRAAWWWQLLRKHHPGDSSTEANRVLRLVTALHRSGAFDAAKAIIAETQSLLALPVSVAGKKLPLRDALPDMLKQTVSDRPLDFRLNPVPLWRHELFDTKLLDSPHASSSHQRNQISQAVNGTVPTAFVHNDQVILDWRRALQSIDTSTGQLKWRQVRLSKIFDKQQSYRIMQLLPGSPAEPINDSIFVSVLRSKERPQGLSMLARLEADTGKVTWQGKDVKALQRFRPISNFESFSPGTVCCVGYMQATPPTLCLAILPTTNKPTPSVDKKSEQKAQLVTIGTLNISSNSQRTLSARVARLGGHIVASISTGQVVAFNPQSKAISWVTEVGGQQKKVTNRYSRYGQTTTTKSATMLATESRIIVKNPSSNRIAAISPQDGSALWYRPCLSSATLIDRIDDLFLVETDGGISAISVTNGKLVWHAPLPSGSGRLHPLITKNRLTVLTTRGIALLDLKTGNRLQFIRGQDLGVSPSQLLHVGDKLLAVSSAGITCYPITPEPGESK